ncbi:MAG: DUF1646 family protein [Deltaproteobacteria bacterium]|nr:DUF1646 family protein [Deltaproteobacteria bacterium]
MPAIHFWGLIIVLLLVLFLPFLIYKVEENLEIFLFLMGCCTVTLTGSWSSHLVKEGLVEPISITMTVLIAGFIFRYFRDFIRKGIWSLEGQLGYPLFAFLLVTVLGLASGVMTAIIAALVLTEVISGLYLDRRSEILLVILACFAIGLGAALTPVGEPLSTIAVAKLRGEPYNAGFLFLLKLLGAYVVPAIVVTGLIAGFVHARAVRKEESLRTATPETLSSLFIRSLKVYLFVMGLVFLGQGFRPMIDAYVSHLPWQVIYWVNSFSAVVDNATLTAAEISPAMTLSQIRSALIALLLAGIGLIPGNIPNIISANKLGISAKEWAKWGIPIALFSMLIYFVILSGISG